MVPWWWSWLLAAIGVLGLWLAGSRRRIGWAVGFVAQALWVAYALQTHQYGFVASALAYGTVYARNWIAWSRTHDVDIFARSGRRRPRRWRKEA